MQTERKTYLCIKQFVSIFILKQWQKKKFVSNDTFSYLSTEASQYGEKRPSFTKVINRHKAGKLKIVGDGINRVDNHIDNVVHAHIKALNVLVCGHPVMENPISFLKMNLKLWEWLNSLLNY